jgi:hypothetical protein
MLSRASGVYPACAMEPNGRYRPFTDTIFDSSIDVSHARTAEEVAEVLKNSPDPNRHTQHMIDSRHGSVYIRAVQKKVLNLRAYDL